jgi:hypothetical protein
VRLENWRQDYYRHECGLRLGQEGRIYWLVWNTVLGRNKDFAERDIS